MNQTIDEAISVLGLFRKASFIPKKFNWQNRTYNIEQITSIHTIKDGWVEKRRYAVLSNGNLYLLEYNRNQETWNLMQVLYEG